MTDAMKKNVEMSKYLYKNLPPSASFIKKDPNMNLLAEMVQDQLLKDNMYRDNAMVFRCGENAYVCKKAYADWVASLKKTFDDFVTDGKANAFEGIENLGYNVKTVQFAADLVGTMLQHFSNGIMLADSGARAWDNRQLNPELDADIPSVTFEQQKYLDSVSEAEETNFNRLWDLHPYLMKYDIEKNANFAIGDQPRMKWEQHFLKGLHVGKGFYLNDVDQMLWAKGYGAPTGTWTKDCTSTLQKTQGAGKMCSCPRDTWMRGQTFSTKNKNKYIGGMHA